MLSATGPLRGKNSALLCLLIALIGCSANSRKPAATRGPSAEYTAMTRASELFAEGREAALTGDFDCAREKFRLAVDVLRSPTGPAPTDPEMIAFSAQLYDSALRYEALAGPAEEAGTSDGRLASDLTEIEKPTATKEDIVHAKEAVDTDVADLTYDVP